MFCNTVRPPIWFDTNINDLSPYQVLLLYPVAKFDKMDLHWDLTSYNKKIDTDRNNNFSFNLDIIEISFLKIDRYTLLFLIKLSSDIRVNFLLNSSPKSKIFRNFSTGNSFYFLIDFETQNFCLFVLRTAFWLDEIHILCTSIDNREYSYFHFFCLTP